MGHGSTKNIERQEITDHKTRISDVNSIIMVSNGDKNLKIVILDANKHNLVSNLTVNLHFGVNGVEIGPKRDLDPVWANVAPEMCQIDSKNLFLVWIL